MLLEYTHNLHQIWFGKQTVVCIYRSDGEKPSSSQADKLTSTVFHHINYKNPG